MTAMASAKYVMYSAWEAHEAGAAILRGRERSRSRRSASSSAEAGRTAPSRCECSSAFRQARNPSSAIASIVSNSNRPRAGRDAANYRGVATAGWSSRVEDWRHRQDMELRVRQVMTAEPLALSAGTTLLDAAEVMREHQVSDVLVFDYGLLRGIVSDREITVRSVAEGFDPSCSSLAEVCRRPRP